MNTIYNPPASAVDFKHFYFKALDTLVGDSTDVLDSLLNYYPELKDKLVAIKDPTSEAFCRKLAHEFTPQWPNDGVPNIMTAARLETGAKGMDILIEAARILHERGVQFRWHVFGQGSYRPAMEEFILQHNLQKQLMLCGAVPNPYPYFLNATLYVQTSRFEGYGCSIAEARLFNTPVVTTAYHGYGMQMVHGKNGLVAELNPEAVADAIQQLLEHPEQYEAIKDYLKKEVKGNPEEFEKFRCLVLQETPPA